MTRAASAIGMDRPVSGMIDDLAVFVRVAELASFALAARRTGMPTSSVSRAVARLEDRLGTRLLRRSSRSVALTEAGQELLQDASARIAGLERALQGAAEREGPLQGTVRITAPAYTGATRVAASLAEFALRNPGIAIELEAANPLRDLITESFDLSIRVGPVRHPDFIVRRLWRSRFGMFAAPSFVAGALGGRKTLTRADLAGQDAVVLRASTRWRFRDARGRKVEIQPHARFAVNDPRAALEVARRGLGIVVAPVDAARLHGAELVALRARFGELEAAELHLVYATRTLLPKRVRHVIDWLLASRDAG